jgi:hypothetical protein
MRRNLAHHKTLAAYRNTLCPFLISKMISARSASSLRKATGADGGGRRQTSADHRLTRLHAAGVHDVAALAASESRASDRFADYRILDFSQYSRHRLACDTYKKVSAARDYGRELPAG